MTSIVFGVVRSDQCVEGGMLLLVGVGLDLGMN